MTIHKYSLTINDTQTVQMPTGARLLSVQMQADQPRVWAMVDPDAPMVARRLRVVGTGGEAVGVYVGTFQIHGGLRVFHLFDLGEV